MSASNDRPWLRYYGAVPVTHHSGDPIGRYRDDRDVDGDRKVARGRSRADATHGSPDTDSWCGFTGYTEPVKPPTRMLRNT